MIGQHKLHKNIFQDTLFPELEEVRDMYERRDDRYEIVKDKIACRYYYYARICRMMFRDCIGQLEIEFDRSERTIIENILDDRAGFIQRLNDDNVSASELKKRYPWYDWGYRPR